MKPFWTSFAAGLLSVALTVWSTSAGAQVASPSSFILGVEKFSSASEQSAVLDVVAKRMTHSDFLSMGLLDLLSKPQQAMVDRAHRIHFFAAVAAISKAAAAADDCAASGPETYAYDPEHWDATPPDEQKDLTAAIEAAKTATVNTGCHRFGVTPDGLFDGLVRNTCSFDLSKSVLMKMDMNNVDFVNLQAQVVLGRQCSLKYGTQNFIDQVSALVAAIRKRSQIAKVTVQLSFRSTPPDEMITAINGLKGIVDGFYVAYPSVGGSKCQYCSPQNLDSVLAAIH